MFELLLEAFGALGEGKTPETVTMIFEVKAMVLGGFALRFDCCTQCGRPYKGEGQAVFIPEKGGIACLKCRTVTIKNPGLSPESVDHIKSIQSRSLARSLDLFFPEHVLEELQPVFKLHREYHLGVRLKSSDLLDH
jgi:DNA repair protein RecO (recombination protein O)